MCPYEGLTYVCNNYIEQLLTLAFSSSVRFDLLSMHRIALSSRAHTNAFDLWLNICYTTPACQVASRRQQYTTLQAERQDPTDVAVLGGGISGLASAYYLSHQFPNARIVLFEGSSRLGGWVKSEKVDVGNGNVMFEQGPRNLRPSIPNGLVTLDLVGASFLVYRFKRP